MFYYIFISFLLCIAIEEIWCFTLVSTKLKTIFLDVPNHRSNHHIPVPRGGGTYFFLFSIFSFLLLYKVGMISLSYLCLTSLGLLLISVVGFIDDYKGVSASKRIIFQALSAILCAVAFFSHYSPHIDFNFLLFTLTVWCIFSLSLINFYNFADGINGYISIQFIISILSFLFFIYCMQVGEKKFLNYALIFFAPIFGGLLSFLNYNVLKKKIFMGDTGSTTLGLFLSLILFIFTLEFYLPIQNNSNNYIFIFFNLLAWIYFTQVIFLDCSTMVIAKVLLKLPISKAHKLHFYQIITRKLNSNHSKTSLLFGFIQIILNLIFILFYKFMGFTPSLIYLIVYLSISTLLLVRYHRNNLKKEWV